MFTFSHTLVRELQHADLEHLAAAADDEELEDEEIIELEIEFTVYGSYRPATWGYYGGEPEEHPEVEIQRVYTLDEEDNEVEIMLTSKEEDEITTLAYEYMDNYDPY